MRNEIFLSLAASLFIVLSMAAAQQNSAPAPAGDKLPIVTHADVPLYPPMARIAHITGTVQVDIIIKKGVITNTEVKSPTPRILTDATLENLKTWKFTSDTNASFRVTYIYEVESERNSSSGNPRIEMQLPTLIKITAQPPTTMSNY